MQEVVMQSEDQQLISVNNTDDGKLVFEIDMNNIVATVCSEAIGENIENHLAGSYVDTLVVESFNKLGIEKRDYPIRAEEKSTVVDSSYIYGDVRRYGAVADGVTDDSIAIEYSTPLVPPIRTMIPLVHRNDSTYLNN